MTGLSPALLGVLLLTALAASFVFSGSETGLISVNAFRLRSLVEEGRRGARLLARLIDRRDQTLVAVLIGNNLALVSATVACLGLVQWSLQRADWPADRAARWAQVLTPLILTPVILFGFEILPKNIFRARPRQLLLLLAPLLEVFRVACAPAAGFLVAGSRGMVRLFGGAPERHPLVTRGELLRLFEVGAEGGTLETAEHDMIQGIIDLGHQTASEVMVPRTRVKMAKDTATCGDLYDLIEQAGHSRIPVYADRVDTVVGVAYARDLLGGAHAEAEPITTIIRPVMHVPESMRLDDLLREMRAKQRSVVIVVDEHGGMAGMVTLEDVIEEIIGEIHDEYDTEEAPAYRRLPDGSYVMAATMHVSEANDALHLGLPDPGVVETLGGFLVQLQGRIPRVGETIIAADWQFHVVAATDRAVQRVRLRRRPGADPTHP